MRTTRFGLPPEQIEALVRDAHRQRAESMAGLFSKALTKAGAVINGLSDTVREIAHKCTAARLGHS